MENLIIETCVHQGGVTLHDLPLKDNTPVKIIIIPRTHLQRLSFRQTRVLLQDIQGDLSDDVAEERARG